jgi:16S rRNA C967 or C1407 C5-methylase (RsmB/RsmF family)
LEDVSAGPLLHERDKKTAAPESEMRKRRRCIPDGITDNGEDAVQDTLNAAIEELARPTPATTVRAALARVLPLAKDNAQRRDAASVLYRVVVWRLRVAHILAQRGWATDAKHIREALDGDVAVDLPADPIARMSVEWSASTALCTALVASLGVAGAERFLEFTAMVAPVYVRVNWPHTDFDVCNALVAQGDGDVITVDPQHMRKSGRLHDGSFEVQDIGSQHIARICRAATGMRVVDLCAGNGGKTLALLSAMHDVGTVFVHDIDERALAQNRGRRRRAGYESAVEGLPDAGTADVVLVDAPCTSVGVLRRSPEMRTTWTSPDWAALTSLQASLVAQGATFVKPGGRLIAATCSVLAPEMDAIARPLAGFTTTSMTTLLPHHGRHFGSRRCHTADGFQLCVRHRDV